MSDPITDKETKVKMSDHRQSEFLKIVGGVAKNPLGLIGLIIVGVFVFCALSANIK